MPSHWDGGHMNMANFGEFYCLWAGFINLTEYVFNALLGPYLYWDV